MKENELLDDEPSELPSYQRMARKKALRDFIIFQNGFRVDIKTGDDLSEIPDIYFQNLITEKVIAK